MASLEFTVEHQLTADQAVERLKPLFLTLRSKHADNLKEVKERWQGKVNYFSFVAKGNRVVGVLIVNDSSVELVAEVPFVVSLMKDKVEALFREEMGRLLAQK